MARTKNSLALRFQPLTPQRWCDFEALFGERGACGGCWCMSWRLRRPDYEKQKGTGNKSAFKKIVTSGHAPGVLAYSDGKPVGWCAVAPREVHQRLENSGFLNMIESTGMVGQDWPA